MTARYPSYIAIVTDNDIRRFLGHEPAVDGVRSHCRVKIKRDGTVHRYGLPDELDRAHDYWQYLGHRDDYKKEVSTARLQEFLTECEARPYYR